MLFYLSYIIFKNVTKIVMATDFSSKSVVVCPVCLENGAGCDKNKTHSYAIVQVGVRGCFLFVVVVFFFTYP